MKLVPAPPGTGLDGFGTPSMSHHESCCASARLARERDANLSTLYHKRADGAEQSAREGGAAAPGPAGARWNCLRGEQFNSWTSSGCGNACPDDTRSIIFARQGSTQSRRPCVQPSLDGLQHWGGNPPWRLSVKICRAPQTIVPCP